MELNQHVEDLNRILFAARAQIQDLIATKDNEPSAEQVLMLADAVLFPLTSITISLAQIAASVGTLARHADADYEKAIKDAARGLNEETTKRSFIGQPPK